jgi:chemotaxis protein CheZ
MGDRQTVIDCLHAALDALEADDHSAWRTHVDELIQWRTQPLVQGLAKLARELDQAMGNGAGAADGGSLPEACARAWANGAANATTSALLPDARPRGFRFPAAGR